MSGIWIDKGGKTECARKDLALRLIGQGQAKRADPPAKAKARSARRAAKEAEAVNDGAERPN